MFGLSANNKFYTFTAYMFRYMCILSGCDYLSSIKGTGIKKAFADVKRNKEISATIRYFWTHRKLDLPVNYETQVNRSLHCFKSQIVIDPLTLNQVLYPEQESLLSHLTFLNLVLTFTVFFISSTRTWLEQLCHLMTEMITIR